MARRRRGDRHGAAGGASLRRSGRRRPYSRRGVSPRRRCRRAADRTGRRRRVRCSDRTPARRCELAPMRCRSPDYVGCATITIFRLPPRRSTRSSPAPSRATRCTRRDRRPAAAWTHRLERRRPHAGPGGRPAVSGGSRQVRNWRLPSLARSRTCGRSPLARATRDGCDLFGDPHVDDALIEMDWGAWEGATIACAFGRHGARSSGTPRSGRTSASARWRDPGRSPATRHRMAGRRRAEAVGTPLLAVTHQGVIRARARRNHRLEHDRQGRRSVSPTTSSTSSRSIAPARCARRLERPADRRPGRPARRDRRRCKPRQ